jgi:hypothetical protein
MLKYLSKIWNFIFLCFLDIFLKNISSLIYLHELST